MREERQRVIIRKVLKHSAHNGRPQEMMIQTKHSLPYQPRVLQHALILVLLPLALGTSLLLMLKQLALESEQSLQNELRQNELTRSLGSVIADWEHRNCSRLAEIVRDEESYFEPNGDSFSSELQEWFSELTEIVGLKKDRVEAVKKRLLGDCREVETQMAGFKTKNSMLTKSLVVFQIYEQSSVLQELLANEWSEQKRFRSESDKLRYREKIVIYVCCVVNIIIAVFLVSFASAAIVRRLRCLVRNAQRIAMNEPIVEHLSGNDELAYLDRVLEKSQSELEEAGEHRKAIIGMVAHDMRAPLMASMANLHMIEQLECDLSDAGFQALDGAYNTLSGIVDYVNKLLSIQKMEDSEQKPTSFGLVQTNSSTSRTSEYSDHNVAAGFSDERSSGDEPGGWLKPWGARFAIGKTGIASIVLRSKLLQKGLLLVLIPLFFQIGLLFLINEKMESSETIASRSRRLGDITLGLRFVQCDLARASAAWSIYVSSGKQEFQIIADQVFKDVNDKLIQMEILSGSRGEWADLLSAAKHVWLQQIAAVRSLTPNNSVAEAFNLLTTIGEIDQPGKEAHQMRTQIAEVCAREMGTLESQESAQINALRELSNSLSIGILVNFSLAMILLVWFKLDIGKRLGILTRIASSLSKHESIYEHLTGNDELSELDRVLRWVKAQIELAAEQRSTLMASLADEMLVPLGNAQLQLRSLAELESDTLPEPGRNHLNLAVFETEKLGRLIPDLLTLESLSAGIVEREPEKCEAFSLAEEAINTVRCMGEKKKIVLENCCTSLVINADRERLVQVLTNYLSNAIKFSPESSCVTVRAEERSGGVVRFSVVDQGEGLDEQNKQNVFKRFFQVQAADHRSGFGLGLAICKLIIESHGGNLGVESKPGSGSTFWFEINSDIALPAPKASSAKKSEFWQDETLLVCLCISIVGAVFSIWGVGSKPLPVYKNVAVGSISKARSKMNSFHSNLSDIARRSEHAWDRKSALPLLGEINDFISHMNEPQLLLGAYVVKGNLESVLGVGKGAIESYRRASEYSLVNGKENGVTGRCYAMIAVTNLIFGRQTDARSFAEKALNILENGSNDAFAFADHSQQGLVSSRQAKAMCFEIEGQLDSRQNDPKLLSKAIDYLSRARKLSQGEVSHELAINASTELAGALYKSGRKTEAVQLINEIESDAQKRKGTELEVCHRWRAVRWFYTASKDWKHANSARRKEIESARRGGWNQSDWFLRDK